MQRHIRFPFLVLGGLALFLSLACGLEMKAATETPLPPAATATPLPPTPRPTATEIPRFFTEEFTRRSDSWDYFLIGSGADYPSLLTTDFTDDALRIELEAPDMYYYHYYVGQSYADVRLDMDVDNLGVNSQNVSLVCRMTGDGWYEFSAGSDGIWYLWTYKAGHGYRMIANGGTTALHQGQATNDYGMTCIGEQIHLFVNAQELRGSPVPATAGMSEGYVGFNVSSLRVTPVVVEVNWLRIGEP